MNVLQSTAANAAYSSFAPSGAQSTVLPDPPQAGRRVAWGDPRVVGTYAKAEETLAALLALGPVDPDWGGDKTADLSGDEKHPQSTPGAVRTRRLPRAAAMRWPVDPRAAQSWSVDLRKDLRPSAPAGHMTVGATLERIGVILFDISQGGPQLGMARMLKDEAVRALGGMDSRLGREFARRYNRIADYVQLARITQLLVRTQHAKRYAYVVHEELAKKLPGAFRAMAAGNRPDEDILVWLNERVKCRIDWIRNRWAPEWLYFLHKTFAC
ncbi:hypothetical protein GT347_03665 [Xylophilus rhododendri]|uniref:Uncharacterized protein n=1 Tax=Xylophilus rhododendri TaxID=2697032 RepID=A0A857J1N5_9BURK|nr:hypothetical protein [Xylophilus rhododendri]QHI97153.1 hypothetical protein GT347_03665 [Xylophilus rhododendri]